MKKRIATILALVTALSQTSAFAMQKSGADIAENYDKYIRVGEERAECIDEMHDAEVELTAEDENAELFADGDFEYRIYGDTVTITGYNGSDMELTIPSEIDGKMVTTIGDSAFYYCSSLKNITLPDSVTTIGDSAFYYCSSLESITIPDSVTEIGRSAFNGCISLESITIPNGVTIIEDWTFWNCDSLTSITIPDSVTTIGDWAFYACSSLESITIPDSVTEIGEDVFYCCKSITSLTVSENNANYTSKDGVLFNKDMTELIAYPAGSSVKEYIIPNGVTEIGWRAFGFCTDLTSVTIPSSVTVIDWYAFDNCTGLTSIIIPDGVTEIGYSTFYNCNKLKSITIPDGVTEIGKYAFSGCSSLTSITIPDGVKTINGDAFFGCSSLTSITIPKSVTIIGDSVFWGCKSITSFTVSENNANYTSKDGVLFNKDMTELIYYPAGNGRTEYTVPVGVTKIGDGAFYGCSSLESITIPDGVTEIGDGAFYYCGSLESITIPDGVTTIGDSAFKGTAIYDNEENWTDSVFYIDNYLIKAKKDITGEYMIKDGTITIADNAFEGCTGLKRVTIPEGITTIGNCAFYYCSSLESVIIPDGITTIGYGAFDNTALYNNENNWTDSVLYIDNYLIKAKSDITGEYMIKDGTITIADNAFAYCNNLKNIKISKGVNKIGDNAFLFCSNLENVVILDNVAIIGWGAFYDCQKLKSVIIFNSEVLIDDYAFFACDEIKIYSYDGSSAEKYANKYDIPFREIKKFELFFDDVALSAPTAAYSDGKTAVNISARNKKENYVKFTIYAVGYNADGAIVGFTSVDVTDNVYNDTVQFKTDEKPVYVKVFAFDEVNGVLPLCKAENAEWE